MVYYCIFAVPSDLDSRKHVGLLSKILTDRGVGLALAGLRKDNPTRKKRKNDSCVPEPYFEPSRIISTQHGSFLGFVVGIGVRAMSYVIYPQHHHPLPSTGGLPGNMFLLPALLKSALEISTTH